MRYTSIVVSGLPGSGKTTLVERIAVEYRWAAHTNNIAQRWRSHSNHDAEIDQRTPEYCFAQHNLRVHLAHGKVAAESLYSPTYSDLPALRIFLTADIDARALRVLGSEPYKGKLFQQIRMHFVAREFLELRVGKLLFGQRYDYRNPTHYHLLLNTSIFSLEKELACIDKKLRA